MVLIQVAAEFNDDPELVGYERQRLEYEQLCADLQQLKSLPALTADLQGLIDQAERAKLRFECLLERYPGHRRF